MGRSSLVKNRPPAPPPPHAAVDCLRQKPDHHHVSRRSVDEFDNFTSDRIAVGYATSSYGACVREMVANDIVVSRWLLLRLRFQRRKIVAGSLTTVATRRWQGEPSDVDTRLFSDTAVERSNGRTVMRFTVAQHWPDGPVPSDGFFRVMWARGPVTGPGKDCAASIGFHGIDRGVCPPNQRQPSQPTLASLLCPVPFSHCPPCFVRLRWLRSSGCRSTAARVCSTPPMMPYMYERWMEMILRNEDLRAVIYNTFVKI